MNILYATGEYYSFEAFDRLRLFPALFAKDNIDWRIIMPFYQSLPEQIIDSAVLQAEFVVNIAWKKQNCELYKAELDGVCYYLLDNHFYFNRVQSLGYFDDSERFAFFSRAVAESLDYIDFEPDILHCNNWQTALIPFYLTIKPQFCFNVKTLLSVFEISSKGEFSYEILEDIIGASVYDRVLIDYNGNVNYLKGGMILADMVVVQSFKIKEKLIDLWAYNPQDGQTDKQKKEKANNKIRLWDIKKEQLPDIYLDLLKK